MLDSAHRLHRSSDFRDTTRGSRRAATRTLVAHGRLDEGDAPARIGFVVSKAVGNAVVRNRVKRRLRHLVAQRLTVLPASSTWVVRALPAAADATTGALGADLDRAVRRLLAV